MKDKGLRNIVIGWVVFMVWITVELPLMKLMGREVHEIKQVPVNEHWDVETPEGNKRFIRIPGVMYRHKPVILEDDSIRVYRTDLHGRILGLGNSYPLESVKVTIWYEKSN